MPDESNASKLGVEWENEIEEDELIFGGGDWVAAGREKRLLERDFSEWHQSFFYSLKYRSRLKESLHGLLKGEKKAKNLYSRFAELREYRVRPIMKIGHISELIFPLIAYDNDRSMVEDALISCIEHEGLKARGIHWQNMGIDVDADWSEVAQYLSKEGHEERRDNFLYAAVSINDIERLVDDGALHWRVVKYLKVWKCYLIERAEKARIQRSEKGGDFLEGWKPVTDSVNKIKDSFGFVDEVRGSSSFVGVKNELMKPPQVEESGMEDIQIKNKGKPKRRKATQQRYDEWFSYACEICDNWNRYKDKYGKEKPTRQRVCEEVAEKYKVDVTTIIKAISQQVDLYIN